jgi:hypothetical protein
MKLIAPDLTLLAPLARTRQRLLVSSLVLTASQLALGGWASGFVRLRSVDVGHNLMLLAAQYGLLLASGVAVGLGVATLLFGDGWRRRVLLGEQVAAPSEDEVELGARALADNLLPAVAIVVAAILLQVAVNGAVHDRYLSRYANEGYFATLLRSPSTDDNVMALRELVNPMNREARGHEVIREGVWSACRSPDATVRAWAFWAAGRLGVVKAVPLLQRATREAGGDERAQAIEALARLEVPGLGRDLVSLLPRTIGDRESQGAVLRALAVVHEPTAGPAVAALLDGLEADLRAPAWAAIAASGDVRLHAEVARRFAEAATHAEQCAIAEAVKAVATTDELRQLGDWFVAEPTRGLERCDEVAYRSRSIPDDPSPPKQVLVIRESLRMKVFVALFNIAAPGTTEWLQNVVNDVSEEKMIRVRAEKLLEVIRSAPPREPRRPPGSTSRPRPEGSGALDDAGLERR